MKQSYSYFPRTTIVSVKRQTPFFLTLLFFLIAFAPVSAKAAGITFLKDGQWNLALTKAKMQNKPIFLFGHTSWCGYCKQMDKEVLATNEAGAAFNFSFINISLDMEKGDGLALKKKYNITAFPTLLYFNSNGEAVHKSVGATDLQGLFFNTRSALDPDRQFYTLRKQVAAGTLSPYSFKFWASDASGMEEKGLDELFNMYFSKQPSIVKDADLMETFFLYKALPTEAQLKELHEYVSTIKGPEGKSLMRAELLDRLLTMAYNRNYNKQIKQLDFPGFNAYVLKFRPDIAELETQKQKVKYYKDKLDYKKAEIELTLIMDSPKLMPGAQQLCKLINEYSHTLRLSGGLTSFIQKINGYVLKPEDTSKGSYKTMALLYLYDEQEDQEMVNKLAAQILRDKNAPLVLKEEAIFRAD